MVCQRISRAIAWVDRSLPYYFGKIKSENKQKYPILIAGRDEIPCFTNQRD
jgi:hypothetical protein